MEQYFDKDPENFHFPICNKCKNFISGETCAAFEVIPNLILLGGNNHSSPIPGQDNDIIFEPIID